MPATSAGARTGRHARPLNNLKLLTSFAAALDATLARVAIRTHRFVSSHPKSLPTAVMLGLAGFGVAAFGIAPMAPDAAKLPKRLVTESVRLDGVQAQLAALADHDLQLYRSDLTRVGDTADTLLKRLNVADADAARFLRGDALARRLFDGSGGKMIRVETDEHGRLIELVARSSPENPDLFASSFSRLTIRRDAGAPQRFTSTVELAALMAQVRMGSGTVRSTLFAAIDEARIPDNVATQLTEAFATDIDFHRELQQGDTFSVLYEALTADGEPIAWGPSTAGRVLAADFVNGGRAYSAVWFRDADGKAGYYSFDGRSKKRGFLSSPMAFSRVTSTFAMRLHPILDSWRQHKGVDYGAPIGAPIRAVADGIVEFAGWQNGYGNVVEILHGAQRSTLYAHMSRIAVAAGARIQQGQTIGAVGMTGWATGPHVHFEFKLNGVQQDPGQMTRSNEATALIGLQKTRFTQLASSFKSQLEVADRLGAAGRYAE